MIRDLGLRVVETPAPAGSLIIWNSFLPHGSVRNDGTKARMMQKRPANSHTLPPFAFLSYSHYPDEQLLRVSRHAIAMYPCDLPIELEWKELTSVLSPGTQSQDTSSYKTT